MTLSKFPGQPSSRSSINRSISGFRTSPVRGKTNAAASASQSSLKLVESAEIHIWRTGAFGVITNLHGRFFKQNVQHPVLFLHLKARFIFFLALNQMLLQLLKGNLGAAAKLQFIQHGPSVASPVA